MYVTKKEEWTHTTPSAHSLKSDSDDLETDDFTSYELFKDI
jgi:hypothetical protein